MNAARIAFWGLVLLAIGQIFYYAPQLPDRMATHFDSAGNADGWQSPAGFTGLYVFVLATIALSFGLMPLVIDKLPNSLINLPHKDYWLAPERRAETLGALAGHMLWMGAGTMLLILVLMQQVIDTNLAQQDRLPGSSMTLIVLYLGGVAIWLIFLFRRFGRPPADHTTQLDAQP